VSQIDATPHEIGAITDHTSLKEIERYTRAAHGSGLATRGMAKLK
jgi:hypothetical protein